jgi:hypothetical protein
VAALEPAEAGGEGIHPIVDDKVSRPISGRGSSFIGVRPLLVEL